MGRRGLWTSRQVLVECLMSAATACIFRILYMMLCAARRNCSISGGPRYRVWGSPSCRACLSGGPHPYRSCILRDIRSFYGCVPTCSISRRSEGASIVPEQLERRTKQWS